VLRHDRISYTGRSADGNSIEGALSGWPSFIFQHELDHLNGITLIQKLSGPGMFGFRDEISSYHGTSL
jgi:peptide deformylase